MKKLLFILYILLSLAFVVFSYGFVDKNLTTWMASFSFDNRLVSSLLYAVFLFAYFLLYWLTYRWVKPQKLGKRYTMMLLLTVFGILVFSYSLVSYDVFNYMTTAKVLFTHKENPYVVMPIEIPNEQNLAFTRAANKFALYGPTWLLLSFFPHVFGFGNIWFTMIAFKIFAALWLALALCLMYITTKSLSSVIFLGLNPLILIEIVVSGHNDIVMMVLAVGAMYCIYNKRKNILGFLLLGLSIFVKGATVVLLPLFIFEKQQMRLIRYAFWIFFCIFMIFTPLREELYPWYAVWFFMFAAMLAGDRMWLERGLTIAFSIGLELRHIPYMLMGYYEGPGPLIRLIVTVVPVVLYLVWVSPRLLSYEKKA